MRHQTDAWSSTVLASASDPESVSLFKSVRVKIVLFTRCRKMVIKGDNLSNWSVNRY